uniref:Uncharacterized protein n=1 Tax=Streptomyces sp. NBC_00049 TaxID=2903617 RepID=A0AAU2JIV1_9ACTN
MTHRFRTRRIVLFAASTAIAAGGVLVPSTAFAATPAAPHTVVADTGDAADGSKSNLLLVVPAGSEGTIRIAPDDDQPVKIRPGKWGKKRPGKGGPVDDKIVIHPGNPGQWQCITAPCGPPGQDSVPGGLAQPGTVDPPQLSDGRTLPG